MKELFRKLLVFLASLKKRETKDVKAAPVEVIAPPPKSVVTIPTREDIVQAILAESAKFVGLKEDRNAKNRADWLDALIKRAGGSLGDPYCLYGIQDVVNTVCLDMQLECILDDTGSTQKLYKVTPENFLSKTPQKAFIGIFQSRQDDSRGHAVLCLSDLRIDNKSFYTREWNTSPNGSRDGDGVYDTKRSVHGDARLRLRGFIKLPEMFTHKGKLI